MVPSSRTYRLSAGPPLADVTEERLLAVLLRTLMELLPSDVAGHAKATARGPNGAFYGSAVDVPPPPTIGTLAEDENHLADRIDVRLALLFAGLEAQELDGLITEAIRDASEELGIPISLPEC